MTDDIFQPLMTMPGVTGPSAFDVLRHYLEFTVFPLATSLYDGLDLPQKNGVTAMIFHAGDENGPRGSAMMIDFNAAVVRHDPDIRLWELTGKLAFTRKQPVSDLWERASSEFQGVRHPLHNKTNLGYPRPAFVDDTVRFVSTLTAVRIADSASLRAVYGDAVLEIGKAVLHSLGLWPSNQRKLVKILAGKHVRVTS